MHEHPGCVEHAAQSRPARRRQLVGQPRAQVTGIGAGADLLARTFEHGSRRGDRKRVVDPSGELVHRGQVSQSHSQECKSAGAGTLPV